MSAPATEAHGAQLLVELFVMLAGAKLLAEIFARLRQPTVVGEIFAGVLIGPQVLRWVAPSETSHVLAELGVIFLLFNVGLETKPSAIFRVGRTALVVAVLGVLVPLAGGYLLMLLFDGGRPIEALFIGTAMVATSVGITARVLGDMNLLDSHAARIILGAAVIDDILGLLVLAAVSSAAKGSVNLAEIGLTAALAVGFVAAVTFFGAPVLTRAAPHFRRLRAGNADFVIAIVLCFGLALAAVYIGVAAIIGAFLAGLALAEAVEHNHGLHQQVRGATEFLVPFFLVNIGMQLDLQVFTDANTLELALLMTVVAVASKLIGCGAGAWGLGPRGALQVGMGMVPRGEVGIVVAQIGLAAGVIPEPLFGAVLFMACATTLIAPPFLRPLFAVRGEG
ncbi:MAG: cation:proton antiporter [Nevskia sp.]|nr:cation:proton antiporter [Nevskia sp.]